MFGEKRKSIKIKLYLIATIIFVSVIFALTSCGKKNTTFVTSGTNNDSIVNNSENDVKSETGINSDDVNKQNGIEYDVYKKIDLSKFIKEDDNDAYIDYENGGLYLADGPCKVTVKANVKVERGPALTSDKINDGFAILLNVGISNFNIYYADYGNNFFDEFHEVERAREYNVGNAGNGKVKFNNIGIVSAYGIYNYKTKYVSHNSEEFIGEFVTDKESQNIMKVTIKDVYYKISKPTGIATEWDLDKDFTSVTANKKQCFFMKELDIGYNYALAPKCTININDKYKKTNKDFILFYYITDNNDVSSCTNIRNERENNISPLYSKVGLGINWNEWRKDGKTVNVNAEWDKNNKTLIVKEKNGDIMGTIKFDYIKEYKYKKCIENDTAGYRRYLSVTNKKQTNGKTTNNKAFADGEKKSILTTHLVNATEENRGRDSRDKETDDKIFCLSYDECIKYIMGEDNRDRKEYKLLATRGTDYARNVYNCHGKLMISDAYNDNSSYWLRSLINFNEHILIVYFNGGIIPEYGGESCYSSNVGVRPAMWVKIN